VLPIALHVLMLGLLAAAGLAAHAGSIYYAGVLAAAILVLYEERLLRIAENAFVLNERVFVSNMAFSLVFLGSTVASFTAASTVGSS
jgi:4-hydroxybenzoate polyprenyltransferase